MLSVAVERVEHKRVRISGPGLAGAYEVLRPSGRLIAAAPPEREGLSDAHRLTSRAGERDLPLALAFAMRRFATFSNPKVCELQEEGQ
jgi:hypothetical protein